MFNYANIQAEDDDAKQAAAAPAASSTMVSDFMGAAPGGAASGPFGAAPAAGVQMAANDVPVLPASPVTWAMNNLSVGRENNDYTGGYSTGMGYAKNVGIDLAKELKLKGLGSFTGSSR
jgi:hypothetical protein